ncbi:MAG: hypothetical protein R2705_22570 [Ilumatobacteraceae bacterium]
MWRSSPPCLHRRGELGTASTWCRASRSCSRSKELATAPSLQVGDKVLDKKVVVSGGTGVAEWVVDAKKYAAGDFDVTIFNNVDTDVKVTSTFTVAANPSPWLADPERRLGVVPLATC